MKSIIYHISYNINFEKQRKFYESILPFTLFVFDIIFLSSPVNLLHVSIELVFQSVQKILSSKTAIE